MKHLIAAITLACCAPAFAADAPTTQQNKMKTCSADFKKTGKPGAERQAYMKDCLSR